MPSCTGLAKDFSSAGWRAVNAAQSHAKRCQSAEVLASADRAATHWETARAGARGRAIVIRLRGLGHKLAKDYPAAIAFYREALEFHRGLSPKSDDVAICLNSLAEALRASGQFDAAEDHYREAVAIATGLPDPGGVAIYTGNLAELALNREQWPEAERLAREALALAEEVKGKEVIAGCCRPLARALARQGRGGEGRGHAERAVAIFTELRSTELAEAQAVLAECQG